MRRLLHSMGYRFRLHRKDLPGTPDIIFPSRKKIIFVHGCFWHGHNCKKGQLPKTRIEYWKDKIARNSERDCRNIDQLRVLGWDVNVVWQCELTDKDELARRLALFLAE